ncbi:MAG: iron-sulfur cluster assembly protein, partial [Pseudomonadota bacterium]
MAMLTKEMVLAELAKLSPPGDAKDIIAQGMVSDIFIKDGAVSFSISVPAERASQLEPMRLAAQRAVEALDGAQKVMVVLTAERQAGGNASQPAP